MGDVACLNHVPNPESGKFSLHGFLAPTDPVKVERRGCLLKLRI